MRGEVWVELNDALHQVPCDLFVWPTRRSYTRQPVVELHTFGSPPLLEALVATLCAAGARLAEPGEYTLRAFLAGRIDLTQAEAVLGVIDAQAPDVLSTALAQMAGGLSKPLQRLREELLQLLAELEAGLDFVEEDIEFVSAEQVVRRLQSAAQLLMETADQLASRHARGAAQQIVLLGRPNAGKSSLFNALVKTYGCRTGTDQPQSPAALVSPQRGTTRDYLIATISLGGIQCEVVDTAGIDEAGIHDASAASNAATDRTDSTAKISATAKKLAERSGECATLRVYCIEIPMDNAIGEFAIASQATDCEVLVLTKGDLLPNIDQFSRMQWSKPLVVTAP